MRRNFSIESGFAEVLIGNIRVDLHNLYGVANIGTDLAGETLTLVLTRDHRWEVPEGLPGQVTLRCAGDLRVAFNNLAHLPIGPDDAVEIAYYDAQCDWESFLDEALAQTQGFEGLHIEFSSGLVLRIRCAEAEMTPRMA